MKIENLLCNCNLGKTRKIIFISRSAKIINKLYQPIGLIRFEIQQVKKVENLLKNMSCE